MTALQQVLVSSAETMSSFELSCDQESRLYWERRTESQLSNTFINITCGAELDKRCSKRTQSVGSCTAWRSEHRGGDYSMQAREDGGQRITSSASEPLASDSEGQGETVMRQIVSAPEPFAAPPSVSFSAEVPDSTVVSAPVAEETALAPAAARTAVKEPTTLMLQNFPEDCTQQDLMDALEHDGFGKAYNFCYLPASFESGCCRGYAFLNFRTPAAAAKVLSKWQASTYFCGPTYRKPLAVCVAKMQGIDALLAQPSLKKLARVRNPAFRPFIARDARPSRGSI
eukprot:CAMPEP_0178428784 /NCGR_PEP_ID=MMETSP0689_2-20121128/30461_1 /TAXON_ID=160604 /ORGANISM="Amphidinium massartii, Strain CS-259" /LENGTH=284 /DNA_ID=CAMNT_0020050577 /DNA_START=46 /DNA_END=900 /DNA_ORIENTATION=+